MITTRQPCREMVSSMPREKKTMVKTWLGPVEYEFIEKMARDYDISKSEMVNKVVESFIVLTNTPLYKTIKPLEEIKDDIAKEGG